MNYVMFMRGETPLGGREIDTGARVLAAHELPQGDDCMGDAIDFMDSYTVEEFRQEVANALAVDLTGAEASYHVSA